MNMNSVKIQRGNPIGVSVAIIGLGLIGGSLAKSVRTHTDHHIIGFDVQRDVMMSALSEGVIDEAPESIEETLGKSDIVFLCLYPFETVEFVKQHYNNFKEGSIVTDTAGLKEDIVKFYSKLTHNEKGVDFVGGHPIAGSEKSGFSNSSDRLFINASYVLTPHRGNRESSIAQLTTLIQQIGFGSVTCMEAKAHDEMIAYTSHLPHIIASLLLKNKPNDSINSLVGGSFRDATRVGHMNTALWTELLMCNQSNVIKILESFETEIKAVQLALKNQSMDDLSGLINLNGIR
ncbi:prephenate dehydrogenase [Fusibacter ferrireducens]|uniref:Prephenate dehydrogenase/arogenate dehydrogenase family protein n=1 Tax=Fusibacter ferrireducens TaxID=2785058 RepID=A0ABR9ZSC9_9FIRM|nr:prephenate dehydrogenase/arogenate dehydrogenase family protein [Fusibacter ferrireducens]MBF4693033.1 prephenate dehydrogenase/arogenate dehydrogenase family protein [Fusibacter ferrireducens]